MATSVPAPMAIPVSARVSAGASFMPSPTMATLPCFIRPRITASLPSGSTPAITSSTPACLPIASAVFLLSPVSITTRMPILRSSFTASVLSSFMTSATAIIPSSLSPRPNINGVLPSSASLSACLIMSSGTLTRPDIKLMLPPSSFLSPMVHLRPLPGSMRKSSTSATLISSSSALAITALARGCSLFASRAAARPRSWSSATPGPGSISVTLGSPLVIVPVLSRATTRTRPVSSREAAVLNSIPFFAPTPLPTIMATGVARPNAQGQLMTSTDMPRASAKPTSRPRSSHTAVVTAAMAITTGTNTPETLSATFAIGAFVAAASLTMAIICESVVSSPTRVARQRMYPEILLVAAETLSPTFLSTGMLSPVSAASFTALEPSSTTPSTGIFSPGRTANISPFCTCSIGTMTSLPSFISIAVCGASLIRLLSASVVLPLERASSVLPTVIRVSIIAADSK